MITALLASVPLRVRAQEAPDAGEPSDAGVELVDAEPEPAPVEAAPVEELPAVEEPILPAAPPPSPEELTASHALAPPPAPPGPPEPPPRWSPVFSASSFSRYEMRKGFDDLGISRGRFLEGDAFFYRTRLGFNTGLLDLGEGLKALVQITPQAAGTFGENANTIADARLGLHEGYARLAGRRVRFDAGRFEMVYGDALMIGQNDWNEIGRTFDGFRARIGDQAWLDLFATVIDEGRPEFHGVGSGDYYFLGAYGALGPLVHAYYDELTDLDVYLLARVWGNAKNSPSGDAHGGAQEFTLGSRAKGRVGACDYRAETGFQFGTRPGLAGSLLVFAWQGDAELGYAMFGERLRLALEALFATGARERDGDWSRGWADLFPSGHKWLGLADAFNLGGQKRTDVGSVVFHATGRPLEKLTVQLDAHLFARPQPAEVNGERGLAGGELDLGAMYTLAKGLRVRALYALFLPSGNMYSDRLPDLMPYRSPDPAHYFEAELRYDLGGSM